MPARFTLRVAVLGLAVACATLAGIPALRAADEDLDSFIRSAMASGQVPGLSLGVARGERVLKHTAYGTLALGDPAPFTTATRLPVLSVTKSFTATAVMMLVEEKKLSLDDRVGDRLPGLPALWRDVTVRQCLSHTSGVPTFDGLPGFFEKVEPTNPTATAVIEFASAAPLDFGPGERFRYSNTAYVVLQLLIEKIAGTSYEDFIGRRVLAPARLTSTGFIPRDTPLERRAHGHTLKGGQAAASPPSFVQSVNVGGGGLESTTGDLMAWVDALASGRLVQPSSVRLMWSPAPLKNGAVLNSYGLGWWLGQQHGQRWVAGIGGPGVGFFTSMTYFPDQQLTIVVMTNSDSGAGRTIAREVANRYLESAPEGGPHPPIK